MNKEDIIKEIMNCCEASWTEDIDFMELVDSSLENGYDELSKDEKDKIYNLIQKRL